MHIQRTSLGSFGTQRPELQFKNNVVKQQQKNPIDYASNTPGKTSIIEGYVSFVAISNTSFGPQISTFYIDAINFQTEAQVYGVS